MQLDGTYEERFNLLKPLIVESFDIDTIARVSLGRTWKTLEEDNKNQFIELLTNIVIGTYANRFDSYNNQKFETLETIEAKPGRQIVKTQLTKSNGGIIPLNYYFKNERIFNVVADGVSDLSLRRADYSAIIKKSGYDALVKELQNKLDNQAIEN